MTPLPNLGSSPAGGEGAPRFSLSTCPISGSHLRSVACAGLSVQGLRCEAFLIRTRGGEDDLGKS